MVAFVGFACDLSLSFDFAVDLRPAKTYQSLYINADFGSDKISVTVGPIKRVLDLSAQGGNH